MANVKITDLSALTTPAAADLLEIVDDVAGTPTSKKITWANLFKNPVMITPALGTPSAADLANATGLPIAQVYNLKPVVNGDVNKLDVFSKSGGAAFDATDFLDVSIPDGNGFTLRNRAAAVASGTGQIILADATNYWSKGDLAAEIKTAYLYAIWSVADGGVVFALNGYSGFTRCPASVTVTDDDYMHLEASSSYTPVVTDYCVAIAKIRYEYDTGDAPDHTIQAAALDAPQVMWNPKSDYGYVKEVPNTITSAGGTAIPEDSRVAILIKQSGSYIIEGMVSGGNNIATVDAVVIATIKTGSNTYASAIYKRLVEHKSYLAIGSLFGVHAYVSTEVSLNAGDTIHLGGGVSGATGGSLNRICGIDTKATGTSFLRFKRSD